MGFLFKQCTSYAWDLMKPTATRIIALALNLGIPGLGHIYIREYLFGIFIFLVMLIGIILFFVSFFLSLSFWPKLVLLGLPVIFYLFAFVDLYRVSAVRAKTGGRSLRSTAIFIVIAVLFQVLAPIAPVNFGIRNSPRIFTVDDNSLSPVHSQGAILKASRLAYFVDIFFIKRSIVHTLPARYDLVRFTDDEDRLHNGIVLGLPGEEVQMVDGVLIVNGFPDFNEPAGGLILTGDCPLTSVEGYSILVATLHLGRLDTAYKVSLTQIVGKIDKLF